MLTNKDDFLELIKTKDDADGMCGSTKHYVDYYDRRMQTGRKISWNWSSSFFHCIWMIYRRMYLNAFIFVIISVVMDLLCNHIVCKVMQFLLWGMLGAYGDHMYISFVSRSIQKGQRHSGVNATLMWVVVVILFIITNIIAFVSPDYTST